MGVKRIAIVFGIKPLAVRGIQLRQVSQSDMAHRLGLAQMNRIGYHYPGLFKPYSDRHRAAARNHVVFGHILYEQLHGERYQAILS